MNQKPTRKLILLRYFREMGGNPVQQRQRPSITEYVGESAQQNEDRAVAYLRGAPVIAARSGLVFDVLDPSSQVPMCVATCTDGVYIWNSTLAHYVEKYHVRLPEDFFRHMESVNWQPPTKEQIDMFEYEF
jgi:hypothetical protein